MTRTATPPTPTADDTDRMSITPDANGHMRGHCTRNTHTPHTARRTDTGRGTGHMGGVHLPPTHQRSGDAETGQTGHTNATPLHNTKPGRTGHTNPTPLHTPERAGRICATLLHNTELTRTGHTNPTPLHTPERAGRICATLLHNTELGRAGRTNAALLGVADWLETCTEGASR